MQRLFGLAGLFVFLLFSEAVSERGLKTVLVFYGKRSDLPVISAIYFAVLC